MRTRSKAPKGFALVITLSLMILLTVIAVGLLTLSSISLRSSSQGQAMATAKSNARLALMMALGELQKAAGPDQRVTAAANLIEPTASPGITGVWESWKPTSTGSNDYVTRKKTAQSTPDLADGEFITWLASGNPASPAQATKPPGAAAAANDNVTLVSDRVSTSGTARGTHLTPVKVNQKGDMAWTVLDEGTKARVDLPVETKPADAIERLTKLRAPSRPQAEVISPKFASLALDAPTAAKVTSMDQAVLHAGKSSDLRSHLHDLTTRSLSLPVNVADGGIKADLTRAFETTSLPTDLAGRFVFSHTKTRMVPSDPLFSTLAGHYQNYKKNTSLLQVAVPNRYSPTLGGAVNLASLDGAMVAPVITRVSVVFSLVSMKAHDHWYETIPARTGDPQRRNMVYMIYTPVVTVYNPYSTPIQFRNLNVTFRNLPVAFKFFRNGQPQSLNPNLLSSFHSLSESQPWEDPFSCTTSNTAGSSAGALVTLYPGEARVFGSSQPDTATLASMANFLWTGSLDASKTKNVFSGAGWDYRSGYIVDWLRPTGGGRIGETNLGVFGVRPTDTVNVEVSPLMPGGSNGKFTVDFKANVGSRTEVPLGVYEYIYGDQNKLNETLSNGNHTTIGKVTYPFRRERDLTVSEMTLANPAATLKDWGSAPKQFAIFTLGTRTATDSLYPGKPGRTSSFVHHVLQMDATKSHPALLPMEMSLLPITGTGANTVGSIDADDANRAFHFSGTSRNSGAIHYVSQDLPRAPLLNLADLRHANLTSSGHLPLVQHTVGESLASPVVSSSQARSSSPFGYEVVDAAWLANQTLWDAYYFSGIRNASDAALLYQQNSLPLNSREVPLLSGGYDVKTAAAKVVSTAGWSDSAATLAIKGGFNVNSTSKSAWKAVLTSLRGLELPVLGPVTVTDPSSNPASYSETVSTSKQAAFPRLARPLSDRVTATTSSNNQLRWSGFRELSDTEVDTLASAIVTEIRARGPFLSMAEFVNRRLGSSTEDSSARGALEAAIQKSGINNIAMGPVSQVISEDEATQFGYANPKAAAGNTQEGASAILSQGDLLSAIGASITVRSDTFVIRTYGAAREGTRVTAKVWCEAVIQRIPEFVNPIDAPEKVQAAILSSGRAITDLNATNRRFGRRFEVVSFRWLNSAEI